MKIKYTKESQRRTVAKHLRKLPGELVTHDAGDKERIHRQDPWHVQSGLKKEAAKRLVGYVPPIVRCQTAVRAIFDKLQQDPFRFHNLDQELVDLWRARTILAWAQKLDIDTDQYHLWFEKPSGHSAELRRGHPPPRGERPNHLKNLNLELHVLDWPARMRDIVRGVGINPEDALEEIRVRILNQEARRLWNAAN
jgi:hypothetical protein